MQHLIATLDALIDAAVEAIVAGFDCATDAQIAMRAKGAELRQRAAVAELLGPALSKLAHQLIDEAGRRAVPRYAAILRSVRYNKDAEINELEDARRTMNAAVLAAGERPDALRRALVMLAIVRVRAITAVIGPDCVANPVEARKAGSGPLPRRREIEPGDISPEVARIVVEMVQDRAAWAQGTAELIALETTEANAVGLVSSLVALAAQPNGDRYLRIIAARIKRAGLDTATDGTSGGTHEPAVVSTAGLAPTDPSPASENGAPPQEPTPVVLPNDSPPPPDDRAARMQRLIVHLAQAPDPRALLNARRGQRGTPADRTS